MDLKAIGRGWWVAAAGGVVLMLVGYTVGWGERWTVTTLQPHELVQSVVATATVQTRHRATVGVQMAGTVVAVKVMEGDRIQPGQVLLQLDDGELRAAAQAAELAVTQAELKRQSWREVQAPVAREAEQQMQANLAQARVQLERQQALVQQGFIGQAALDESWRAFRVAQAQASSAQAQSRAHAPDGLEQSLAQSAWLLAQANWAAARARLSYTEVRASFAGQVVSRHVEPGDTVQPGKALLVLVPEGVTELVALIDERNLSLLRPGQPAVASADAYPQHQFAAVVSRIAPSVDAQRGAVQVNMTVATPPAFLREDMTISVEIEVLRKPAALTLPLEAVQDIEFGYPWVWRVDDQDRVQRTPVTLGVRAGSRVEVMSGVSSGSRVLDVAAAGLKAGQRIRVAHRG
ncbi:MAG: efflux RND transporter periplasmic adaptor subunit [Limnohabitans sp.]